MVRVPAALGGGGNREGWECVGAAAQGPSGQSPHPGRTAAADQPAHATQPPSPEQRQHQLSPPRWSRRPAPRPIAPAACCRERGLPLSAAPATAAMGSAVDQYSPHSPLCCLSGRTGQPMSRAVQQACVPACWPHRPLQPAGRGGPCSVALRGRAPPRPLLPFCPGRRHRLLPAFLRAATAAGSPAPPAAATAAAAASTATSSEAEHIAGGQYVVGHWQHQPEIWRLSTCSLEQWASADQCTAAGWCQRLLGSLRTCSRVAYMLQGRGAVPPHWG